MSFIYKITNDINDKIYIGKTNGTIDKRFQEHCRDCSRRHYEKRPLYNAMNKYGIEHFKVEQIEECPLDIIDNREKYWIEYYDSFKNGYNATLGGDGKAYIDRILVIKTYNKMQNQNQVAKILNISQDSVSNILKENKIIPLKNSEVMKREKGHAVAMLDKDTKQILKVFSDQSDAARWLMQKKKTTIQDTQKVSYIIGRVARGLRKTAYNYIWKSI